MATIAELLQTEDPAEQATRVEGLLTVVGSPVITVTATVNMGTQKVQMMFSENLSFDDMYALLDILRREIMQHEREAALKPPPPPQA